MAVAGALLLTGCVSVSLPERPAPPFGGIANFGLVATDIYRGGQPTAAGFDYLKHLGVKTIIKLNTEAEGNDAYAETHGMTVQRIPITFWQQIAGPVPIKSIDQAARSLGPGTFIHCEHGQDRTGLFVYRYRRLQGWSKPAAQEELLSRGFHRGLWALWRCVKQDP